MTTKKVTVVLDEQIITALRKKQCGKILRTNNAVSFSSVLNEALAKQFGLEL